MINCTNVAAGQAESYYRVDDYYSNENPPAAWSGKAVAVLGLEEANAARDFGDLLRGKLPDGSEIPGGAGGKRRAGTDVTISAPKSVSIAALVNGDQRVINAHNLAVERALQEVEKRIQAREVIDGQTKAVTTGNMIARTVLHDTSRTGDPNLHTHCVIINATQTEDGRWKAIENREIFRMQRELDMIYKSELALALADAGYQLRSTKNGFELAQIDERLIAEFSKRKDAIDQALADRGTSREGASAEEREKAALNTRDRKIHFDRAQLAQIWRERGQALGLDRSVPVGPLPSMERDSTSAAAAGLDYATQHLGEREQAWRDIDLQAAAMSTAWGSSRWSDVVTVAREAESSGAVVRKQDGTLTTPAAQRREAAMLQCEVVGRGAFQPLASDQSALKVALEQSVLNDKQRAAVEMLMTSTNQVVGIQGRAGVGKTTLLDTFRQQAEAAGWRIEGLAPSHSAVQALAEAGIQGKTLQSWEAAGSVVEQKTILLVDESSLVSVRQMWNLLKHVGMSDSRLVVVGDIGQYQSVDAGKAFAQLQANGMETAIVDKMLRQQVDELRLVANLAAEGKGSEALAKLGDQVLEIVDRSERHAAIARDYAALNADERKDTLILTGSNADRQSINGLVREALGLAGQGRQVEVFERGDLTSAQMRRAVSYRAGDAIRFEKDYRSLGAAKGEIWMVSRVEGNEVVIGRDGQEQRMRPADLSGKGLTVGRIVEREVAAGDRLRISGDIPALVGKETLRNGQRATVLVVQGDRLEVKVDGRSKSVMLAARKVLSLDHGYAATGHSAQGLGASRVFLERDSHCRTASERQFYTDVTRVKHELRVYTDDRNKLSKAVERQVDKSQALDYPGAEQPGEKLPEQVIEQVQQVAELAEKLRQVAPKSIDHGLGL
jgi:conjugative relaxase-like TrwC/TraI family protein